MKKYVFFSTAFLHDHIRTNQTVIFGQKFPKTFFGKEVQLCFETSLFVQNFYQYVAVYLVSK